MEHFKGSGRYALVISWACGSGTAGGNRQGFNLALRCYVTMGKGIEITVGHKRAPGEGICARERGGRQVLGMKP